MNNLMEYKGYHAKIEYSNEDNVFVGTVIGINDTVAFDGDTIDELRQSFQDTIDGYLAMCEAEHREPDKEYRGMFNIRIDPELHRKAALESQRRGITLNKLISLFIEDELRLCQ